MIWLAGKRIRFGILHVNIYFSAYIIEKIIFSVPVIHIKPCILKKKDENIFHEKVLDLVNEKITKIYA